jgi:hypothetical protein
MGYMLYIVNFRKTDIRDTFPTCYVKVEKLKLGQNSLLRNLAGHVFPVKINNKKWNCVRY